MKKYMNGSYTIEELQTFLKKRIKRITQMQGRVVLRVCNYGRCEEEIIRNSYSSCLNNEPKVNTYTIKNKYNAEDQMVEGEEYSNEELMERYKYKYDEEGRLKEVYGVDIIDEAKSTVEIKYDEYENEIYTRKTSIEDQADNYKEYIEYYYDRKKKERDENRVLSKKKYEEGPDGDKLVHEIKNSYDKDGYLLNNFEEEREYYGDMNVIKWEELIENAEEKREVLKKLKSRLKVLLEKGVEYREEEIILRRIESTFIYWDDYNEYQGRKVKITLLVPKESGSWKRKKIKREVGYKRVEGYDIVRKIEGGGREEITVIDEYEYDVVKKKKGRFVADYVSKKIYDGRDRVVHKWRSYLDQYRNKKYEIVKSRYEGDNLVEESTEVRICKVVGMMMGRRVYKVVKKYKYDEEDNKIREEEYDIIRNEERLIKETIYNSEEEEIERVVHEKGKIKVELKTTEVLNEDTGRKLVVVKDGEVVRVAEEDEDGDPRIEMMILSENPKITKFEYYEGEYY